MEKHSSAVIRGERLHTINLVHSSEELPAGFHQTLHDPSVFADDPVKNYLGILSGYDRGGILEHDKVENRANLRVGGLGELVEPVEVMEVARREGWVSFQAFQKYDFMFHNRYYENVGQLQSDSPRCLLPSSSRSDD